MLHEAATLREHAAESAGPLADTETTTEAVSPGSDGPGFRIYDDSMPASSQPQTPLNLPESRHRSRLLGAYTAPAGLRTSGVGRLSRRLHYRRTPSPAGLDTPGFQGLYGGLENSDDGRLYEQAQQWLDRAGSSPEDENP